ncbi:APC family permease [Streptomyces sp. L06]|nr:APC family permease [Streptomyces sp. L06]
MSVPPQPPQPAAPGLRTGTLTTADISFFVVSAAAPLTVMAGVAPIAIMLGGIGAPAGYLLAGLTLTVIDFGAKVLGVLLVAETGILLLLAGGVLLDGGASGLTLDSFTPAAVAVPGMAAVLACAFAAFTGFESTAIYRREARDPRRTIPRATFIAVAFLGLFYAFIVWTVIQAYGSDKVVQAATDDAGGLFFAAITTYVGAWAADLMHVLIVSSVVASLLAFHNAINRYTLSLTEEGLLPPVLGRIHPRHRSPYLAGAAQTAVGAVVVAGFALADADPYTQLLLWVNTPGMIGLMALQLLAAAAVLCYFRRIRHREGVWRTVVAPVAAIALLGAAIALVTTNVELFSGAGTGTNILLVSLVPAVFVLGVALALRLRRTRPEVYARFAAEPEGETRAAREPVAL